MPSDQTRLGKSRRIWITPLMIPLLLQTLPNSARAGQLGDAGELALVTAQQAVEMATVGRAVLAAVLVAGFIYLVWCRWARARLLGKAVTAALQSREEQAQRMALIANRTDNALIVTDADGVIEWVNAGFTRMTGYAAAEALGTKLAAFLSPSPDGDDDDDATVAQVRERLFQPTGFKAELNARTKSGSTCCVSLEVQPVGKDGGGFIAVAGDITRRMRAERELRRAHDELETRVADRTKALAQTNEALQTEVAERARAEAALRTANERTRLILENALDAVISVDAEGRVSGWNAQAQKTFGWTVPEVLGRPLTDTIIPTQHREAHLRGMERARDTGRGEAINRRIEVTAVHRDGREFPVELAVSAIPAGNGFTFSAFVRDISERKQAEKDLTAAKEAAEAATHAKSEFLANMSHEIRTPMSAILGYADLLLEPEQTPSDRLDRVNTIRRNGEHLLTLINGILDLSKIEAGEMRLEHVACNPCQLVSEVASTMRVRAAERSLELQVRVEGPIPETIQTDPTRVRQILINLVGNAVKFTDAGWVRVGVRLLDPPDHAQPRLQFAVTDTGIGMSPEQAVRVFEPFAQADTSTTRRFGGTGLGLTISRRLARMLGGDIVVDSLPGRGTCFTLTIATGLLANTPMSDGFADALTETGSPAAASEALRRVRGRVLLAEDGVDNQRLLAHYLRQAGADVTVAENGREASDAALAAANGGNPFDLVLMDMQMPVMDGYAATSRLRSRGYPGAIVALTAHAMAGDREKCLNAGCTDYLTKPVDKQKLIELVARHLPPADVLGLTGGIPAAAPPADNSQRSQLDDPDVAPFLASYIQHLPGEVARLADLLSRGDLAALDRVVHGLKGSGGLYGFPRITEQATRTEQLLRGGADVDLVAAAAEVDALARLIRSVDGYDPARERVPGEASEQKE